MEITTINKRQAVTSFKQLVDGNYVQGQFRQVLGQNAGTFTTSLMEVYTNDSQLQTCDPKAVMQEAIKAATLKLPLNKQLGYAYIIVFNNWDKVKRETVPTPTLVIGYRGFIQLAMRTAMYKTINADVVYEGELVGGNKLTGSINLSGNKISDRVVGYFAHFELTNGFQKTLYMGVEDVAKYALKYAPSFKVKEPPSVDSLVDMANKQAVEGPVKGMVGWKGDFNSMAVKTVLRRLLGKYGYLSIEMMNAMKEDEEYTDTASARDEAVEEEKPELVIEAEEASTEAPAAPI